MSPVEQVASNIYDREDMPVAKDIGDGAGVTHIGGQTDAWLQRWRLTAPTGQASAIWNIQVWLADTGLAQVCNQSVLLGDCVADWAYNSGEAVAIMALQRALNQGLTVDGKIGTLTMAALVHADYAALTEEVAESRIAFLRAAVAKGEISPSFSDGLLARAQSFLT